MNKEHKFQKTSSDGRLDVLVHIKRTRTTMTNQNKMTKAQIKTLKGLPGKASAQIRYLDKLNMSRGDIVRMFKDHLGREIRYQHVRNVLITPVKTPRV